MIVRVQQFGTAVLPGTFTAQAFTSTEVPLASLGWAQAYTASLVPRFGASANGPIAGAVSVCSGPPFTETVTAMFSVTRIGRAVNELMLVIQTGTFVLVWVDLTAQPVFGQANTASGPAGSVLTPQLLPGTESPNWFTHTDTWMSSPRGSAVVPWCLVRVGVACLWAASVTVLVEMA